MDTQLDSQRKEEELNLKVRHVCRNLFGPVDHQQLQQDFQRLLWRSVEVAKQKWNFDFLSDSPVDGSLEWEQLKCQEVPTFYRSCVVRNGQMLLREAQGTATKPGNAHLEDLTREDCKTCKYENCCTATLGNRRQTSITDFYVVKKRCLCHKKNHHQ
ncbi:cyclin-dependent kinase inhibitor 1D [Acipenser oxyrinchus oxyrinchus]|uniref:Cyclin-dependent kinase inhibitor 1D n=1 Tax=Acipenser oxyrinchus oxyrinchus TaxID=40147 RepID=A0AAD8DEH3_ACIOX|nr:cyclin-dependent kinase inhibitor 1D [Acipenser oxyrinchus oxyrinchus]